MEVASSYNASKSVSNNASNSSYSLNNFDLNDSPASDSLSVDRETEVNATETSNGSTFSSNFMMDQDGSVLFVPDVSPDQKPVVGTVFSSYNAAVDYYKEYGIKAGFGVRKSTVKYNKKSTNRYVVCSKHGVPKSRVSIDTLNPPEKKRRRSNFKVTDCNARICLKGTPGSDSFVLVNFIEGHNHALFDEDYKHLSRPNRQLELSDKEFIHKLSSSNIGPTKAHRLNSLLKGGYSNLRGTVVDYKNFRRDISKYIGNRDAQMLVEKLEARKVNVPNFSFEYLVEDSELSSLFWADDFAKYSYEIYGDVLAFDATYDTNMYKMVFVPFTGVDNHGRCITFGGGLLKKENIESYKWLLEAFIKAHGKQPTLVLTDQDPAVKQALPQVFPDSNHRLCMWHIMRKLPSKVSADLLVNTDIRKRLYKIVWNVYLSASEFEDKWKEIIKEFNLGDNSWLSDVFEYRERWIPGFFKEIPMCCLMKTTSRSESENAFFSIYSSPGNTYIQFISCFETAMEKQRNDQIFFDNLTSSSIPLWKTELEIERYASSMYTRTIFLHVQKEIIRSVWSCIQKGVVEEEGSEICTIMHKNKDGIVVAEFKVIFEAVCGTTTCECDHITRHGYPCRHMFYVWNSHNIQIIPQEYLLKRWTMNVLPEELRASMHKIGSKNFEIEKLSNDAFYTLDSCISLLKNDPEKLASFVEKLKKLKKEVEVDTTDVSHRRSKNQEIKSLLGVESPKEVLIKVPQGIRNKGCGTKKRLAGPVDKAKTTAKKKAKKQAQKSKQVFKKQINTRSCTTRSEKKKGKEVAIEEDEENDDFEASDHSSDDIVSEEDYDSDD